MRTLLLAGASLLALSASLATAAAAPIFADTTPGLTTFTAPSAGTYDILATGAQGGKGGGGLGGAGGLGVVVAGDFTLAAGEMLAIAVGGAGAYGGSYASHKFGGGGGGGGSFVVGPGNTPLVIAGGGGGGSYGRKGHSSGYAGDNAGPGTTGGSGGGLNAGPGGTNGAGGGGYSGIVGGGGGGGGFKGAGGNGAGHYSGDGGGSFPSLAGGAPGGGTGTGGFGGGGGGGRLDGGGGGGYSGGGGGGFPDGGGGGGSFLGGTYREFGYATAGGNGSVTISEVSSTPAPVPEPASLALFGSSLAGLGLIRRRKRG